MVSLTNVAAAPQTTVEATQPVVSTKVEEQTAPAVEKGTLVAKAEEANVDASAEITERADIANVENKA